MKKNFTINTFAKSSLKHRKKQYSVMIIGILISMVLSCTVLFFASSMLTSIKEYDRVNYSECDGFHYSSNKQQDFYESAKNAGAITDYGFAYVIGRIFESEDESSLYFNLAWLDKSGKNLYYPCVIEGEYPTASGQIALEKATFELLVPDAKVGDDITVLMRGQDGETLLDGYVEKTFKLVGILKNKKTNFTENAGNADTYFPSAFVFDESDALPGSKAATLAGIKINHNLPEGESDWYSYINFDVTSDGNDYWLYADSEYKFLRSKTFSLMFIGGVFCVALLLASFIGIVNAMNSNLTDRKKQIGMLRTVGATKGQIRKIFGREAMIISVICTPASVAVSYVIIKLIAKLYGEEFVFILNVPTLIFGAVFGIICVMAASVIPLMSASRISPVQSIRNIDITRKMNTGHIKTKSIFNVSKLLAKRNINLYRKKQIVVSFFLVVTIVVSCLGYSFIEQEMNEITFQVNDYELGSAIYSGSNYPNFNIRSQTGTFSENIKQEVIDIPYIKNVSGIKQAKILLEEDIISPYIKLLNSLCNSSELGVSKKREESLKNYCKTENKLLGMYIFGVEESVLESYKSSIIDGAINMDAVNSGSEVIIYAPDKIARYEDEQGKKRLYTDEFIEQGKDYISYAECSIKPGDEFTVNCLFADNDYTNNNGIKNVELIKNDVKIGGRISEKPREAWFYSDEASDVMIFTSNEGFKKLCGQQTGYCHINATLSDYYRDNMTVSIEEEIENTLSLITLRIEEGTSYHSNYMSAKNKVTRYTSILIAIVSGMVLFMAGSVSIINNSLTARIREGKREMGTLRAVGATNKELTMSYIRQLLSMFGWGTGIGFGIFFTVYVGYYAYCRFTQSQFLLSFSILPAVIATVIIFAVCSLNLYIKIKKETKNSIIDNIREL